MHLRRRLHALRRLLPPGPRRRLSTWLRRKGFSPDAHYAIRIEYPTSAANTPRWNPHPELERIVLDGAEAHWRSLDAIAAYRDALGTIELHADDPRHPSWANAWLPPLDGAAIYAFIRSRAPKLYVEIGSGESTKFAVRARDDGALETKIISIDPQPRAEVDELCDRVIRLPLETADLSVFSTLSEGDIVFFDGSHRVFMNSDATVFFLEVLPRLAAGVLVGVHDVFLPYDYPQDFADRFYSEQYLLAAHLIAGNQAIEPVLATFYATRSPKFRSVEDRRWSDLQGARLELDGHAFWLQTRRPAQAATRSSS